MLNDRNSEQLNQIVEEMLGREFRPPAYTALAGIPSPFDTSKPNIHDTKKEFLKELRAVEQTLEAIYGILKSLGPTASDDPTHKAMTDRLGLAISLNAFRARQNSQTVSASDLMMKNAVDLGLYNHMLRVLLEASQAFSIRRIELKDQEKEFWSLSHRAPNYFARTIALRLARFYTRETGERPTFGISSEGNYPSTAYGRALEKVFAVLKIRSSVRNAADWALSQLTDDDFDPPKAETLGGILGLLDQPGAPKKPKKRN